MCFHLIHKDFPSSLFSFCTSCYVLLQIFTYFIDVIVIRFRLDIINVIRQTSNFFSITVNVNSSQLFPILANGKHLGYFETLCFLNKQTHHVSVKEFPKEVFILCTHPMGLEGGSDLFNRSSNDSISALTIWNSNIFIFYVIYFTDIRGKRSTATTTFF